MALSRLRTWTIDPNFHLFDTKILLHVQHTSQQHAVHRKGVLFRLPLKPEVPAVAQQRTSPLVSVIVTIVLLNVALMCAMARVTFRRTFFLFVLATDCVPPPHDELFERLMLETLL